MTKLELPAGTHYAAMWDIPDQYAGMTASMLQRSRAFVEYAGVEVAILTFVCRPDTEDVRERLRARGVMVEGMRLVNMWEDLWSWGDAQLAKASFNSAIPGSLQLLGQRGHAADPLSRELRNDDGDILQVDYFRPDGTILLVDERNRADSPRRRVTLCDTSGEPIGTWDAIDPFRAMWLDTLPRDPVAWMIADSKTSADALVRYQRPDVVKMHVVRGSHVRVGDDGATGPLSGSRERVMRNLHAWDAVMFLTKRQLADVEAQFGPQPNLHVIPNSRNMPSKLPQRRRQAGRGVMLASLDARKQIDHAISAMAAVKRRLPFRRIRLDVWGRGKLEAKLSKQIKQSRAPVHLHGHSPTAADEFSQASFSLLTSRSEAFGNVLIESMGRGCIPISYDMPYGPSDIITHGVDGYLVPAGDKDALAEQIFELVTARESDLAAIRQAGRQRALEFSDERLVERWSAVMAEIATERGL
jgi:poly(glycerol-phosphate) alpha-glucosyltransferase